MIYVKDDGKTGWLLSCFLLEGWWGRIDNRMNVSVYVVISHYGHYVIKIFHCHFKFIEVNLPS